MIECVLVCIFKYICSSALLSVCMLHVCLRVYPEVYVCLSVYVCFVCVYECFLYVLHCAGVCLNMFVFQYACSSVCV